jgi:sodium transport system permease protein
MNFTNLRLLYRKEMLDLLRDRRTLISLIIAPVLVGPAISGGMAYFMERSRSKAKVERYVVGIHEAVPLPGLKQGLAAAGLEIKEVPDARAAVESKSVTFGIDVGGAAERPHIRFFTDRSEMMVNMARSRVNEVLDRLAKERVRAELAKRNIPLSVIEPFSRESVNVAQPRKMTGSIVGTMIGFLLLIFLFNGAMYSAVDATAGEKERRTLEMLLSSAAARVEIVLAKVCTAMTTAFGTTALGLASWAIAFSRWQTGSGPDTPSLQFPTDPASLSMIALLIVPVAILAAAIGVAASTPAKSTREAMSYLTPGFFVVIFLGMITFIPDLEAREFVSVIPFANFSKMLRHVLAGEWSWTQYGVTLVANLAYAAVAVGIAVRSFQKENILFRT